MSRRSKKSIPDTAYVVINKDGLVFAGMRYGYFYWSPDWSKAKPLLKENTGILLRDYPELELVKEEEF